MEQISFQDERFQSLLGYIVTGPKEYAEPMSELIAGDRTLLEIVCFIERVMQEAASIGDLLLFKMIERLQLPVSFSFLDVHHRTTLLHYASDQGQQEVGAFLMERGCRDVNARSIQGITPLMLASYRGCSALVERYLLVDGVDVNLKDITQRSAILYAAMRDRVECIRQLVEVQGILLSEPDIDGNAPLDYAKGEAATLLEAAGAVRKARTAFSI